LDGAVDVKNLSTEQIQIMNKAATNYGMEYGDYVRMLMLEEEEKEEIKQNKLLEAEKAQFSVKIRKLLDYFYDIISCRLF
jgi:hypothetical protein